MRRARILLQAMVVAGLCFCRGAEADPRATACARPAEEFAKIGLSARVARFELGSTARPNYRAFHEDFRGVADPEKFALEFEDARRAWNEAHPGNPNNMPTDALRPVTEGTVELLREESRVRLAREEKNSKGEIAAFLERANTLRERQYPYADVHDFLEDVANFFGTRNPVDLNQRADTKLLMLARLVVPEDELELIDKQFRLGLRFGASSALDARQRLARFRKAMLDAIDRAETAPGGTARFREIQRQYAADRSKLEQALKRQKELGKKEYGELTQAERREQSGLYSVISRLQRTSDDKLFGPSRRQNFYADAVTPYVPRDRTEPLEPLNTSIIDYNEGILIPRVGFASIRGQIEGMLNNVETLAMTRKPARTDGVIFKSDSIRRHDNDHFQSLTQIAIRIRKLPLDEKRKILNGIDSLPTARDRELAEIGLYIALHEDFTVSFNRTLSSLRFKASPTEVQWVEQWFKDFISHLDRQ